MRLVINNAPATVMASLSSSFSKMIVSWASQDCGPVEDHRSKEGTFYFDNFLDVFIFLSHLMRCASLLEKWCVFYWIAIRGPSPVGAVASVVIYSLCPVRYQMAHGPAPARGPEVGDPWNKLVIAEKLSEN